MDNASFRTRVNRFIERLSARTFHGEHEQINWLCIDGTELSEMFKMRQALKDEDQNEPAEMSANVRPKKAMKPAK